MFTNTVEGWSLGDGGWVDHIIRLLPRIVPRKALSPSYQKTCLQVFVLVAKRFNDSMKCFA